MSLDWGLGVEARDQEEIQDEADCSKDIIALISPHDWLLSSEYNGGLLKYCGNPGQVVLVELQSLDGKAMNRVILSLS